MSIKSNDEIYKIELTALFLDKISMLSYSLIITLPIYLIHLLKINTTDIVNIGLSIAWFISFFLIFIRTWHIKLDASILSEIGKTKNITLIDEKIFLFFKKKMNKNITIEKRIYNCSKIAHRYYLLIVTHWILTLSSLIITFDFMQNFNFLN